VMLFVPVALSQHAHSHSDSSQVMRTHHPVGESDGKPAIITGYVRDVACLLRNPKAGAATTPLTQDCMQKCIRGGSPIGILTEEGRLYTPISDVIPDASVRSRMLPYVGKYIKASGKVFERGEFHAISIQSIEIIDRPADSRIPAL
jgi:hypothetical protein